MAKRKAEEVMVQNSDANVQHGELRRRSLLNYYKNEETIPVNIAPLYKPYFGNAMTVSVNGISVVIPCDGKTRNIPKTHATEALARLEKTNDIIQKRDRMKDISRNFESSPGELEFF